MKTSLNKDTLEELCARIEGLQEHDHKKWGNLTVHDMLCHVTDAIRTSLGTIPVKDRSTWLTRSVLGPLALRGMPIPKGKIKTFPEIEGTSGHVTPATDFDNDKNLLNEQLHLFLAKDESFPFQAHGIFGSFDKQKWARIIYVHCDYHLKQFGR